MSTRSTSIFKDPNVAKHLSLLHDKYVIVSADKVPNNIVSDRIHVKNLERGFMAHLADPAI
jgi:hypothetical protein